eukprot:TRINITY_DN90216_c0_g1_i1.p1 TRINITY_DN90216_c0_g1~~TRINITY_DN90216_c0_g1_i1.p1  ORF type:complete len:1014 (-),score=118.10 TRINITY_DN90216_c0_g1_i1:120-3161(-)
MPFGSMVLGNLFSAVVSNDYSSAYIPGTFNCQQANYANQVFEKRLAAIGFTNQWQDLHRDDVRDLMALTVGRMDVYQLVGVLLLGTTFSFYTSNTLMQDQSQHPANVMLFLMCTFFSAAYVFISVWLALHASVICQCVGTRLLTSVLRYSIPTRGELDQIVVSMIPVLDRVMLVMKQACDIALGKVSPGRSSSAVNFHSQEAAAEASPMGVSPMGTGRFSDHDIAVKLGQNWNADVRRAHEHAGLTGPENCDVDTSSHFRQYLQAQQSWQGHDAYARATMALGMHYLMQAIAYYVLAELSAISYAFAAVSCCGFHVIALIIMKIEVKDFCRRPSECFTVFVCFIIPPIWVSFVQWFLQPLDTATHHMMLAPCFVLHGLGAAWIYRQVRPTPPDDMRGYGQTALVPNRWRTHSYLNVINLRQHVAEQGEGLAVREMQACHDRLRSAMKAVMHEEHLAQKVSSKQRSGPEITTIREEFERCLQVTSASMGFESRRQFERLLDHFVLWQLAPDILASFEVFRTPAVQNWLDDSQKQQLNENYEAFVGQCQNLDLGIVGTSPRASHEKPLPYQVAEKDRKRFAQVQTRRGSVQQSVCVDSQTGSPCTSFESRPPSLSFAFGGWKSHFSEPARHTAERSANVDEAPGRVPTDAGRRSALPAHFPLRAPVTLPPDQQAANIINRFSQCSGALWFACALIQLGHAALLSWQKSSVELSMDLATSISVSWPGPSNLFEAWSLGCTSSTLVASTEFATFLAGYPDEKLGQPVKFTSANELGAAFVICGPSSCQHLALRNKDERKWSLATMAGGVEDAQEIPVPASWQKLAGSFSQPCNSTSCEIILAGWDEHIITVAKLWRSSEPRGQQDLRRLNQWHFSALYPIRPDLAACATGRRDTGCRSAVLGASSYTNVQALQLLSHWQLLLILHGDGLLDGWDLDTGELIGRWELRSSHHNARAGSGIHYGPFCHAGNASLLLFERRLGMGASLKKVSLPSELSRKHLDYEIKHGTATAGLPNLVI